MNTLRLNFASDPGGRGHPARWWLPLCASTFSLTVAALLYAGWLLARANEALQQLQTVQTSQGPIRPVRHAALQGHPGERLQVQFAQQTARRLQAPWSRLLAALEDTPPQVALLVVEPNVVQRSVVIGAETANADDMLEYLRQVQNDPRLQDMHLVSHTVQAQSPGTPMRFQIEGHWGDTP